MCMRNEWIIKSLFVHFKLNKSVFLFVIKHEKCLYGVCKWILDMELRILRYDLPLQYMYTTYRYVS